MGCVPAKVTKQQGGLNHKADSEKLPQSVLDGFGQVLKSSVSQKFKVFSRKQPKENKKNDSVKENVKTEEDVPAKEEQAIERNLKELDEVSNHGQKEEIQDDLKFVPEDPEIKNLEMPGKEESERSGIESKPINDPSENPVFENIGSVYIVEGFE